MQLLDARTGMELLTRAQCFELLAEDEVGRLAVVDGMTPHIFPVNYVLDGETIVFRTDGGTKLERGLRGRVSFQIDSFDRVHRSGWSVEAAGRLEEVTDFDRHAAHVRSLGVQPWAGEKQHWVRLVIERISGRRVAPKA